MLRSYLLVYVKDEDGYSAFYSDAVLIAEDYQRVQDFVYRAEHEGGPIGVVPYRDGVLPARQVKGVRCHSITDLGPYKMPEDTEEIPF